MWELYVFSFLAGLFAANALPHLVKGGTGQRFQTPFGKNSSAIVNVLWGWANALLAVIFLHFSHPWPHAYRASVTFVLAALVMLVVNALIFSRGVKHSK